MGNTMEMDKETFRRLQLTELEILTEVDRICRKNKIKYNLCAGTLLGAVRHQGFIPWDDDVDIRMLYSEYVRFKDACKTDLNEKYFFLQDFDSDPKYRWGYAKMLKKGTTYIRTGQEELGIKNGVWIDIFISDGIPNLQCLRPLHTKYCFVLQKVLWSPVGAKVSESKFLRVWYSLLSKIPRSVPIWGIKLSRKLFPEEKSKAVVALTFPHASYGWRRELLEELTELEFEGHMFFVPKDWDEWLTDAFGINYMEFPPPEQRIPHNTASYYEF